ncbi:glycosyltransferase family 2 protein [Pseudodonghicola flavimaris]|uniref:Glycosyltransferase n=1 Tax=Pseudodonghicola flavimaris TaxID=3050036 RepID=A0ABT7F871_9RHOB|nr:glycosyltransferase [Pseudodonghicola flavimaris]MDK3020806.1 glycosyltransferase [Pseudodonghicola flavimaris]
MTLTLAIPCHNDAAPLGRLLQRIATLDLADQVIVVDDGSVPPLEAAPLAAASGLPPERLTLLRNDSARGPGAARNQALARTSGTHLLFLDADDLPTRELPELLRDLAGEDFDFCQFQYHDTRMDQEHVWGQTPHDQRFWHAAGVDLGALSEVGPDAAAELSRTANYPWNKLYRTEFLRAHAIGCSEILVHEDIELHWRSYVHAGRILASDRIGVIHFVSPEGLRLTNRTGPERLALFEPLGRLATEVRTGADGLYALPFFGFALGLFDWIAGNLDPAWHRDLAAGVRTFVDQHVPEEMLARLRTAEPERTARVLARAGLS